jgi:GT2 family glycosyltransferase
LLLNPDVTVPAGFLDAVLEVVADTGRAEPYAGVIGLRLCNPDGSLQGSCGRFPTLGSTLRGLLRRRAWRKCVALRLQERQQVDWVTGGCLLVRRACFEELGGLDESFFLYYEDVDFCRRAKLAGWQVWYEPRLTVTHHWPLHARSVPAPLRLMTRHALMRYAMKHWPARSVHHLQRLMWWESWCRQLWSWLRGDRTGQRCYRELRRVMRGLAAGQDKHVRRCLEQMSQQLRIIAAAHDMRADTPQ